MTQFAPIAARFVRRATAPSLTPVSRFRFQARFGSLDALTGQVGTLVRAATGTAVDRAGVTYTAGHSMPRWEARDWAATGVRDTLGLRLGADDLTWPANWLPETATLFVAFSEAGTRTTANAGLVYVGNDGATGGRVFIDSTGTNFRATIHNGTTPQTVSLATATPTTAQSARLALQLDDNGTTQRVRLLLRVGVTDTTSAWSSTVARAAAFGSGAKMRANRIGSAGTLGSTWLRDIGWFPGLLTLDECEARL
jgi:hypothetical protein